MTDKAAAETIWRTWARFCSAYWLLKSQCLYGTILGGLGRGTRIVRPLKFSSPKQIFIGSRVTIHQFCWLGVYPQKTFERPTIVIGDGVEIGHFNHITCVNRVEIGAKVLTADRVHISDNEHVFANVKIPIIDQGVTSRGPVVIGEGTWIGENVSVLSCKIGRNCVIGANAVVTADVPDFSVAVGVPARVVKRFDEEKCQWIREDRA